MAYSAPKVWSHGEYPIATELQKYSDDLNEIYLYAPDADELAVPASNGTTVPLVHVLRWLVYDGEGRITDGASNTMSLSANSNIYDLDQVEWLTYGTLYYASGVTVCFEDWNA